MIRVCCSGYCRRSNLNALPTPWMPTMTMLHATHTVCFWQMHCILSPCVASEWICHVLQVLPGIFREKYVILNTWCTQDTFIYCTFTTEIKRLHMLFAVWRFLLVNLYFAKLSINAHFHWYLHIFTWYPAQKTLFHVWVKGCMRMKHEPTFILINEKIFYLLVTLYMAQTPARNCLRPSVAASHNEKNKDETKKRLGRVLLPNSSFGLAFARQ